MSSLHIVYASTSGHTEYVVDTLIAHLKEKTPSLEIEKQQAEKTTAEDLTRGDVLVLASSTWNTGNVEGQLNPHMYMLLLDRAKEAPLGGKKMALIALGDERYFYTANAAKHLETYAADRGATLECPTLKIVNEPYGQEEKIGEWGDLFLQEFGLRNSDFGTEGKGMATKRKKDTSARSPNS